jgi:hypothetical protein
MKKFLLILFFSLSTYSKVYYVDPAAVGDGSGSDWTNAITTLQVGVDSANAANDTVYMRGSEILTDTVKFGNGGSTAGFISFIGCNASGIVDGTRYELNANGATNVGVFVQQEYIYLANIYIHGAVQDGFKMEATEFYCQFHNIESSNNGQDGFTGTGNESNIYFRCVASKNSVEGFSGSKGQFLFCRADSNTSMGISVGASTVGSRVINCVSYRNGDDGFFSTSHFAIFIGNTSHGNGRDGFRNMPSSGGIMLANRSTGNTGYGFNFGTQNDHGYIEYCYANGNVTGDTSGFDFGIILGAGNVFGTGEAGYTDSANNDFSLTTLAALRRNEIIIDSEQDNDVLRYYLSTGLAPTDSIIQ